jgi:hypothetical protein
VIVVAYATAECAVVLGGLYQVICERFVPSSARYYHNMCWRITAPAAGGLHRACWHRQQAARRMAVMMCATPCWHGIVADPEARVVPPAVM